MATIGPDAERQMTELDVDDLAVMMAALLIAAGYEPQDGAQIAALMVEGEMEFRESATRH